MQAPPLPRFLIPRLPFFYGWVVLGCICLAGFARQGPAVAVLSIFVVPMTDAFGWSRTEMSGAVSLGGVLAAIISPIIGPFVDRRGARLVLCLAVAGIGIACMALSLIQSLLLFYLLFCFARMIWAGPFDLGLYGALNNWFVARRAIATSIRHAGADGRAGRPAADRAVRHGSAGQPTGAPAGSRSAPRCCSSASCRAGSCWCGDRRMSACSPTGWPTARRRRRSSRAGAGRRRCARRPSGCSRSTPSSLFPVQAGVSLHKAPHLIERGLSPVAGGLGDRLRREHLGVASFGIGFLPRRWPVRYLMAAVAVCMASAATG